MAIGRAPGSQNALDQLRLLLLLLLGCAVQGPTKEHFIAHIKELSLDAQHDIVECIKQVRQKFILNIILISIWSNENIHIQERNQFK